MTQMQGNYRIPEVPTGYVDVVLDTDAFNEIDDQFAIAYLIRSTEKMRTKTIYAAPFFNHNSASPADGMEKSCKEIFKILGLLKVDIPVYEGSREYLPDEKTFVESPAARDLVRLAKQYTPENPLYVVAIGAITNVASAIIMEPEIARNITVVWLGGHARHYTDTKEFNMWQDVAAARVVMQSDAGFVQLPCMGVVSEFRVSEPELEKWMYGKGALADYLAKNTVNYCRCDRIWSKVIWDVTAVAWLLNDGDRFMLSRTVNTKLPTYDGFYSEEEYGKPMEYVYSIKRDALMQDLVNKLTDHE